MTDSYEHDLAKARAIQAEEGGYLLDLGEEREVFLDKHGAATGSRDTGRRLYVVTEFPGKEKHGRTDEQIAALNESNGWDETRCVNQPEP